MGGFRKEKAYENYAWIFLFGLGIIGLVFALWDMFSGVTDDPQSVKALTGRNWEDVVRNSPGLAGLVLQWVRAAGIATLGFSIFGIAISISGYRKGIRWTWYASWSIPAVIVGFTLNNASVGGSLGPVFLTLLIVAILGLLLPYRKFFPKKQPVTP